MNDRPAHSFRTRSRASLRAPKTAIWPTPEDRNRLRLGTPRPRQPSRAILGVWIWAILYNLIGFAILAALWWTMH